MLTTAFVWILAALALLAALGFVLLPVMLMSGVWAHFSAKEHARTAWDIERLLAER